MIESFRSQRANVLSPKEISAKQVRPNGLSSLFTFSLRWKVALSFSVLLLLIVGFLFLGFMWYERVFLSQESQKRAQSLANSMVINARDPLLNKDDLRLAPIIESVSQDTEVRYAYLWTIRVASNTILIRKGREDCCPMVSQALPGVLFRPLCQSRLKM